MLRSILFLATLAVFLGAPPALAADDQIGSVTRVQGEATSLSGAAPEPLFPGAPLFTNQKVATGIGARLQMTFDDGTQVTLGEHADMTLDTFVYNPAEGTGTMKLAVVGAFRFVSGRISKQAKTEVAVATPVAVIGVRGTDFFGGPIDNQALGVLLLEGAVTVTNPAGAAILDAPGEGTNILAPGDAPGPVTQWPQDKVARALASVTFQ